MEKRTLVLISTLGLIFFFFGVAFAQDFLTTTSSNENEVSLEFSDPGLLPGNPFYIFKIWGENIATFFTFGEEAKAERYIILTERRMAEIKALAEKEDQEITGGILKRYQEQLRMTIETMEKVQNQGKSVEKISARVAEVTGKHLLVLDEVYEKVPESAKDAILKAKEASLNGQTRALNALVKEKPETAIKINLKTIDGELSMLKVRTGANRTEEIESIAQQIESQYNLQEVLLDAARKAGKDTTSAEQLIGKELPYHLEDLGEIYNKALEDEKSVIENVIELPLRNHERIVESLKIKNALNGIQEEAQAPKEIPEEIRLRIQDRVNVQEKIRLEEKTQSQEETKLQEETQERIRTNEETQIQQQQQEEENTQKQQRINQ